jgi:photosystem II stability/assembly factor-like uncharacterized protein
MIWSAGREAKPVAGPIHVHAVGVNPGDRSVMLATHTGLFRIPNGESQPTRVGDSYQDTMGFTVVGADHFLGSGHPDPRSNQPRLLGLVQSTDAGNTWKSVSLLGKADFHILRAAGRRVYGFDAAHRRLLTSDDTGTSWQMRSAPNGLLDLVLDPQNPRSLVASTMNRLFRSRDAARSWHVLRGPAGLLAWSARGLFVTDPRGGVWMATAPARPWMPRQPLGGSPATFAAAGNELYAAVHEGSVLRSSDGAQSWRRINSNELSS